MGSLGKGRLSNWLDMQVKTERYIKMTLTYPTGSTGRVPFTEKGPLVDKSRA